MQRLRMNIRKAQWNIKNRMNIRRVSAVVGDRMSARKNSWSIKKRFSGVDKALTAGAVGLMLVTVLAGAVLTMRGANAEQEAQTRAAVTVSSSCQMNAVVNSAHEAEVTASTYRSDIGKTTITVACNDANGYDMYAVGFTNSEFGRTDMLGDDTGRTISTGTATSGQTSNWAMKLTSVAGQVAPTITTGYTAYHTIPGEYTKVASYNDSTMEAQTGSQFETTYAVYAASLQSADTYVGKVKYTLVHPSDAASKPCAAYYTVNYNNNGGSGAMDSQTVCSDKSVGIPSNGFTAPAPVAETQFAVWNTAADGSGYTYLPGQSVANLADAGGSVTLYAQWAPRYIQDLTASNCAVTANVAPLTVYDRRDENSYTVRYLQGACWMTQNLRIKGAVRSQYSNFSTYDTVNVCEGTFSSNNVSYVETRCQDSGNTTNGVWYNFAAVSAKTIVGNNNSNLSTEDICPSGWSVPTYDANGGAGSINSLVNADALTVNAFTPVGGGFYSSTARYSTSWGFWWSNANFRILMWQGGSSLSTTSYSREDGQFLRCARTNN